MRKAKFLISSLAEYDLFQFDNRIKPDYCSYGGLEIYDARLENDDGTVGGWCDFYCEDGREFGELEDADLANGSKICWQEI